MSSPASDAKTWESRYEHDQTGWERQSTHPALLSWIDDSTIKPTDHVAVPGCGRGSEPLELAQRGFNVTAIDFSETAIKYQTECLRGFESTTLVVQENVFSFEPPSAMDVVYEQTCLCAINTEQREAYEQTVYQWLKPGGQLLALFMQTETSSSAPPFHCDIEEMKQLFHEDRWVWPAGTLTPHEHPRGNIFELAVRLKRKDSNHVG